MSDEAQEQAVLVEERALQAASDVEELDRPLPPSFWPVGPDGELSDKAADLAAHRTASSRSRRSKRKKYA